MLDVETKTDVTPPIAAAGDHKAKTNKCRRPRHMSLVVQENGDDGDIEILAEFEVLGDAGTIQAELVAAVREVVARFVEKYAVALRSGAVG